METFYNDDCSGCLAFFGKITSNITHELNNVFSIINECTGIIEDQLNLALDTGEFDIEKVIKYKDKIISQIDRGKHLNKQFNQFAHIVDFKELSFELDSELSRLILLTKRIAFLREITLDYVISKKEKIGRAHV